MSKGKNLDSGFASKKSVADINKTLWAVVVVLVLGFLTLLVTVAGLAFAYMHDSQDVYRQAQTEIKVQNDKIETLIEKLREQNEQKTTQIIN